MYVCIYRQGLLPNILMRAPHCLSIFSLCMYIYVCMCDTGHHNASMIQRHEEDTAVLMRAVKAAVDRPPKKTMVVVMTGGRNFIKGVLTYVCMLFLCSYLLITSI